MQRRRWRAVWILGLVLVPLLVLVPVALAQGDEVVHLTGELQGDQYAGGGTVVLDRGAVVHGDLLAAGRTIIVYGTVDGSVMAAGTRVEVYGHVGHAVRVAGGSIPGEPALILAGRVDGDLVAYGTEVDVREEASVGGNTYAGGGTVDLGGTYAGDVQASGSTVTIAGTVQGDADLGCSTCKVREGAVVAGGLTYTSADPAQITGIVRGHITQLLPEAVGQTPAPQRFRHTATSWITGLLGAWAAGALLLWLWPRAAAAAEESLRLRPGHSVGWGALALFCVPLLLFVLLVLSAVLGLLVRIWPYGASVGLVVLGCYLLALVLSQIVVGYTIGRLILCALKWDRVPGARFWEMLLGVLLLALAGLIPYVGGWFKFAVVLFGMGAIIVAAWRARRRPAPGTVAGEGAAVAG